MTFSRLLLAICLALQIAEAQIHSIAPFKSIGDYKGQYVVLLFIPDLKKACVHDLLTYSAAADDFNSIGTQLLIISSDGAATEEDIKIPIIGNSKIAKEYGMEGASGIFIVDQEHRLRSAQISNCDQSAQETFRLIMAFKFSDKKKVAIPSSWQNIEAPNIDKNEVKKLDFYKQIPLKIIPIESNGAIDFSVEEMWMGPAQYGDMYMDDPLYNKPSPAFISYRSKCFRYNGTVFKDNWSWTQVDSMNTGISNPATNECFFKARHEMQVRKTITYYCSPDLLWKHELDRYQLHGQMTYCELMVEEKSGVFLPEVEPPVGEWNGDFLVARRTNSQGRGGMADSSRSGPGDVVEAHVQITPTDKWQEVMHSTFGSDDPEMFLLGPSTPECVNRAFAVVSVLQGFVVYCPADTIFEGRGWKFSPPGMPIRMTIQQTD